MTLPSLEAEAAALLALDDKRTQGEWQQPEGEHLSRYVEHVSEHDPISRLYKLTIAECIVRHPKAVDQRNADAAFIAAAPRMVALIRKLLAALRDRTVDEQAERRRFEEWIIEQSWITVPATVEKFWQCWLARARSA